MSVFSLTTMLMKKVGKQKQIEKYQSGLLSLKSFLMLTKSFALAAVCWFQFIINQLQIDFYLKVEIVACCRQFGILI